MGSNRAPIGCAVVVLVCVLIAACQPSASASAVPSTGVASAAAPSRAPTDAPLGDINLHSLDPEFVPSFLRSADGQVLWSARHGELWRYVPGRSQPERVFRSAHEDSAITDVVASAGGYAFVETSTKAYGDGGWRVWYLSGPAQQSVELDRGNARNAGSAPTLAMDDARIAWAGFDEPDSGWVSRLRMVPIADLEHPLSLLSFPIRDALLWYPFLHANELWFGIIHPDFEGTGTGNEFHIETLDLANPQTAPVRFSGSGHDFNPAVNDDVIVWKTAEGDSAALNWGTIHVQARGAQAVETIPVPNGNRPSIGARFVAFDEITHSRLEVFDLTTRSIVDLGRFGADAATYGGLSVSGDLLAWFSQGVDGSGLPRIGWTILSR